MLCRRRRRRAHVLLCLRMSLLRLPLPLLYLVRLRRGRSRRLRRRLLSTRSRRSGLRGLLRWLLGLLAWLRWLSLRLSLRLLLPTHLVLSASTAHLVLLLYARHALGVHRHVLPLVRTTGDLLVMRDLLRGLLLLLLGLLLGLLLSLLRGLLLLQGQLLRHDDVGGMLTLARVNLTAHAENSRS